MNREAPLHISGAWIADDTGDRAGLDLLVELPNPTTSPDRKGGASSVPPACRILAIAPPDQLPHHPAFPHARHLDLTSHVLLSGLVNAHAHLDLTALGPRPDLREGGFAAFARTIRDWRATATGQDIRSSTDLGIARSKAGGVVAIADIAGAARLEPVDALRESGLWGVSHLELFGIGARQGAAIARMRELIDTAAGRFPPHPRVALGLSPHAPYSVGPSLYHEAVRAAQTMGWHVATHLAESMDERRFIAEGTGPLVDLLRDINVWDASIAETIGHAMTPIQHCVEALNATRVVAIHANDVSDNDIDILAMTATPVVYCPRAHEWFGYERDLGPHRYRDMRARGVRVALGTDSIVNLGDEALARLTPLDDARLLHGRDATDPCALIAMITTDGAHILGLDDTLFRFPKAGASGDMAGLVAIRADEPGGRGALRSLAPPRLLSAEMRA